MCAPFHSVLSNNNMWSILGWHMISRPYLGPNLLYPDSLKQEPPRFLVLPNLRFLVPFPMRANTQSVGARTLSAQLENLEASQRAADAPGLFLFRQHAEGFPHTPPNTLSWLVLGIYSSRSGCPSGRKEGQPGLAWPTQSWGRTWAAHLSPSLSLFPPPPLFPSAQAWRGEVLLATYSCGAGARLGSESSDPPASASLPVVPFSRFFIGFFFIITIYLAWFYRLPARRLRAPAPASSQSYALERPCGVRPPPGWMGPYSSPAS